MMTVQNKLKDNYQDNWGAQTETKRFELLKSVVHRDECILDLGCGRGAYVNALFAGGYNVIGIDYFKNPYWSTASFVQSDAFFIPFKTRSFDTTFCFEVLEHCQNPENVLNEINRITKKNFLLSVPDCRYNPVIQTHSLALNHWTDRSHVNFFTPETICRLLHRTNWQVKQIGYADVIDIPRLFWHQVTIPKKIKRMMRKIFNKLHKNRFIYSAIVIHVVKHQ